MISRVRFSVRVAASVALLALLLVTAGATAAGYLVEAHNQRIDREHRLADAAAYIQRSTQRAGTASWKQALSRKLAALALSVQLTVVSPAQKRSLNARPSKPPTGPPAASYLVPLPGRPRNVALAVDVYAPPLDQTRRWLVAVVSGLAALVIGGTLLLWATSHWLVLPLRRLSSQVDAIAGGDPLDTHGPISAIREVENLAAAIRGMATTLAQTADRDAQFETERRLLITSIAHDLRTPLFSLGGYLDAIATGIGNPRERLDQARKKTQQIEALVTGLFDYARAEIDHERGLQKTRLAGVVADTATAFELEAKEHGVALYVSAHANPVVVIGRDAFERALANVIDNALRHTPPGGTVEVTCGEDVDDGVVCVIDGGRGIAPDLLPHLFEPTARAKNPRYTGGAGLGLAIANRLLRSQGGTIDAANLPPRGAIFTLRLPHVG